jgi:hypothetical protein
MAIRQSLQSARILELSCFGWFLLNSVRGFSVMHVRQYFSSTNSLFFSFSSFLVKSATGRPGSITGLHLQQVQFLHISRWVELFHVALSSQLVYV